MMAPVARVTILIPIKAYDWPYLEQALQSVRDQTSPDWRLLVIVEPGDADHFTAVLGDRLLDSRTALITYEGRALAGKLKTGMRHATTDFAASLLGDDLWSPTAVEVLTRHIEAFPRVDFFTSSRRYIDDDGRSISSVNKSVQVEAPKDFERGSPVKHLLCWRVRKALSLGGVDESLNSVGPDDWDFPWTMAEHGAAFMPIEECLYLYRDHRRCFRLTTHVPLSQHKGEIRRIMMKHGVDRRAIKKRLAAGGNDFLHLRHEPRRVWREPYA
jgi:glycosyltransferase involved in cell wall biosynthesis